MSITIIWQTIMRNERDLGQKCIVCFMEYCPRKTEEIYRFWSSLHVKNQERLLAR